MATLKQQLSFALGHWVLARGLRPFGLRALTKLDQLGKTVDLIRYHRIDVVLDVGANNGQYASHLRGAGYTGRLLSFEPIPSERAALERKAAEDPLWQSYPWALGAEDGQRTFNLVTSGADGETVLSSFLSPRNKNVSTQAISVDIRRLDSVLPDLLSEMSEPRIFLKMDTQGFDLEVLSGLGSWLDRVVLLQSEVSVVPLYEGMPHFTRSLERIEQYGFALRDLFVVNRSNGYVLEYDCLMDRAPAGP